MIEEEIKNLIEQKNENKNVDYKEKFNWDNANKDKKSEIVKDILAMFNTQDGGKIIFGVEDESFNFVGVTDEDFNSFDQTKVNDFLHKYTDPECTCYVHKMDIEGLGKTVVIDVPEFNEVPIICKKTIHSSDGKNKLILQNGQIYIRTEKATSEIIPSYASMRTFLQRAIVKKKEDLLRSIEVLISGKEIVTKQVDESDYKEKIKESADLFDELIRTKHQNNFGNWTVIAYPVNFESNRIENQKNVADLIGENEVKLRGWNLPHTDRDNSSNFKDGFQSITSWERHVEIYKAYKSGLFFWKKAMFEDVEKRQDHGIRVMSFVSAIWLITEIVMFLGRYYSELCPDEDIKFQIKVNGLKNRKLVSLNAGVELSIYNYISGSNDFEFSKYINVLDLKVNYIKIIVEMTEELFRMFNWNDAKPAMIENWINKLLSKDISY